MNYGQSRWTQYLLQMPSVCFHSRHGFVDFTLSLCIPLTSYNLTSPKSPIDL